MGLDDFVHSDDLKLEFFMLDGESVGCFTGKEYPTTDGRYSYEAWLGSGRAELVNALNADGAAECYYDWGFERVFFTITADTPLGLTQVARLSHFRRQKR